MSVPVECPVLSDRGPCVGLITCQVNSYRMWLFIHVCDQLQQ